MRFRSHPFALSYFVACVGFAQPRGLLPLNADWNFIRRDVRGAELTMFNDSTWERVSIPHTWNALDGQDGGNDYYRGVGWYRKTFTLDSTLKEKSLFLKFDAASIAATVYLNGSLIGEHKGAFGAFCFDISPRARIGKPNVLAVKVSNAFDSTIAPLRGDFTMFGGLYRLVHLLVLEKISISPIDFASSGVYVRQDKVTLNQAELTTIVKLRNDSGNNSTSRVVLSLFSQDKRLVSKREITKELKAKTSDDAEIKLTIDSPQLWNGVHNPNRYTLTIDLFSGARHVDQVEQQIGLRFFSFDTQRGFYLDGEPYRLHGVSRHQDRENKGWAIGIAEHREDFALIEEIGANAVRLAHYQQAKEFYSLCDSGGIAVYPEIALVDFVSSGEAFLENCKNQLRELIKQNYDHPSIICWGLFNELIPDKTEPLIEHVVAELNQLAKELDPTRPTVAASRSMYDGSVSINRIPDLISFNIYRGWYEPDPNDLAVYVDDMHRRFPDLRIAVGEYGAGASIRHHEHPPRLHSTAGKWHPEEWQSHLHEIVWEAIGKRDFLWGSFVWNMFDFASDSRAEGDRKGINDKGLVTHDRKTRKDTFYWYKANWNPVPMVHITEKRFSPRPKGTVTVKVYSNAPTVELFQDGTSLGTRSNSDRIFLWQNVVLQKERHDLIARAHVNSATVADTCSWLISQN